MDIYREQIKNSIKPLSDEQKLLFASLTSMKLYPNYVFFENETGWGNHKILSDAADLIYNYLVEKKTISKSIINEFLLQIDSITPDTEDFETLATSFALDACTAMSSTLNFIIDKNTDHILDVAIYARDTVDMYIQEKEQLTLTGHELEIRIESDFFMVQEKKRQLALIEIVRELDFNTLSIDVISQMTQTGEIIDLSVL